MAAPGGQPGRPRRVRPDRPKTVFRPLDGLLLLDKPQGPSSNQALQRVRHLVRAEKGGHTGSLDPMATGLLPLCFGEATKLAGGLLGQRKAYRAELRLGMSTDTDDAEGQPLVERPLPPGFMDGRADRAALEAGLAPLRGRIRQRAPIYAALKQGGEPLYAKARRGEVVEAPVREVEVFALDVVEAAGARVVLDVTCGSGTYVRALARDLGEALGCGAHLTALRRTWVEPFTAPRMITLAELEAAAGEGEDALRACLLPIEAGLAAWPRLALDAEAARRLRLGQAVPAPAGTVPAEYAAFGPGGAPLGLVEALADGRLAVRRLLRTDG